ncbi:MAG TPA: DUF4199 domain-containing protein [Chitinophagaceae bacterium]|nr:DUF4199 domain-containing protein [Chitinophagaceae bacterium]
MKSTAFRYGLYGTLVVLASGIIQFIVFPKCNFKVQEVIGYLTILLSMIFVFIGIRHYRNYINNGELSFGQGLKVGTLIVLIPSVFFGLFDIFYAKVLNPKWGQDYLEYYSQQLKENTPPEKLQPALDKLQSQMQMFSNPVMQFLIMFGTVFVIGFIVAIISALALRRRKSPSLA